MLFGIIWHCINAVRYTICKAGSQYGMPTEPLYVISCICSLPPWHIMQRPRLHTATEVTSKILTTWNSTPSVNGTHAEALEAASCPQVTEELAGPTPAMSSTSACTPS